MAYEKNNTVISGFKIYLAKYEYELILLVYLLARFIFKNTLGYAEYFTAHPIWGHSSIINIALGSVVVILICAFLAFFFGQLIRRNGKDYENATLILVALFFACPVTLPFLFNTDFISGTQMLYPFAFFVICALIKNTPYLRWLTPLFCALYFIPAMHSSSYFFTVLYKGSLLYVPLILIMLIDFTTTSATAENKNKQNTKQKSNISNMPDNSILFRISLIVSVGSYIYALNESIFGFGEYFQGSPQNVDIYLAACLLICSPALFLVCVTIYKAHKSSFPLHSILIFVLSQVVIFPLFQNNYYGLWIPFVTISVFLFVFTCLWQKNRIMLVAAQSLERFFKERKLLLLFALFIMASLSNTSTIYSSSFLGTLFSRLPY